jgi:type III pantothenate kinase
MTDGKHILAIDVGNTRAKFGLFRQTSARNPEPLEIAARILNQTADVASAFCEWWLSLGVDAPDVAMVAASDPETRDLLLQSWPINGCRPITVFGFRQIPVEVDVDFPERVGVDRLLNAFAGGRMSEPGRPVIVVDS